MRETPTSKLFKVGELAQKSGKTVRALHLYEELGLLKPAQRSEGGFRLYAASAVERIAWLAKLQEMGFSLNEIKGFVKDWENAKLGPEAMQRVRSIFEDKLREAREHMARLGELEKDLVAGLAYLDSCRSCASVTTTAACVCCDRNGHKGDDAPMLVAGIHETGSQDGN